MTLFGLRAGKRRSALPLIPAALLGEVIAASVEQERLEGWIMSQVEEGVPLPGLYPPNEENAARYRAWVEANPA